MGKAFSNLARRSGQRYNAENRAQKAISLQQADPIPTVAPKHPSTAALIEDFQRGHPEYLEEQKKKHEGLDERLKGLVVNPDKLGEVISASRPLPTDRRPVEDNEYGYLEPSEIRQGYCSMRQALQFIGDHGQNAVDYTADQIASEYHLDKIKVQNILKYYQVLQIQFPRDSKAAVLAEQYEARKARFGMPEPKPLLDISQEAEDLTTLDNNKSSLQEDRIHEPPIKR